MLNIGFCRLAILAFAVLASLPFSTAATVDEQIGNLAGQYVTSGQVPGIIVGVSRPGSDFTVITRGVANLDSLAPMNAENYQRIGSITKSFTVTRILQLVDEGRLSLNDPISKYVPDLRNGSATLRQLANMTSGIFNYTEDRPFILRFAFHPTEQWTDRQLVAVANQHEPYFEPGAHWHYSNTNTVLLGMVVKRVTENSLADELTRHILRPLGLGHTHYPTMIDLPNPFTSGYATLDSDQGRIDVTRSSPTGSSGAGAMISTLGDMRQWGSALARGTEISRRAQFERLQMVNSSRGIGPFYDRYGLGLGRIDGWIGHTADLLGYQSLVMQNLVANETVVIFVNASNFEHIPTELFRQITPLLPRATPAAAPSLAVTGPRIREGNGTAKVIRGLADSTAGILIVRYSVNGGSYRIARGGKRWHFRANLQSGANVIRIQSVDRLGQVSRSVRVAVVNG